MLNLQYYWSETIGGQTTSALCDDNMEGSGDNFFGETGSGLDPSLSRATRVCAVGGRFEQPNTTACVNCGLLLSPLNGFITINATGFGSVANYSCMAGYRLAGIENRVCQENATWSGANPNCEGN